MLRYPNQRLTLYFLDNDEPGHRGDRPGTQQDDLEGRAAGLAVQGDHRHRGGRPRLLGRRLVPRPRVPPQPDGAEELRQVMTLHRPGLRSQDHLLLQQGGNCWTGLLLISF